MGTANPKYGEDDALGVLLRAFDVLSGLLEEPATVSDGRAPRERTDNEVMLLREANSQLRALAIQLSNLVGDLPVPR